MPAPSSRRIAWWAAGDVDATVGLLLDSLTTLVILAALLTGPLGFGREIVFTRIIPGTALAWIVDGALRRAALALAAGAVCVLFGLMRSPRPGGTVFWPWDAGDAVPFRIAAGYLAAAVALLILDLTGRPGRREVPEGA